MALVKLTQENLNGFSERHRNTLGNKTNLRLIELAFWYFSKHGSDVNQWDYRTFQSFVYRVKSAIDDGYSLKTNLLLAARVALCVIGIACTLTLAITAAIFIHPAAFVLGWLASSLPGFGLLQLFLALNKGPLPEAQEELAEREWVKQRFFGTFQARGHLDGERTNAIEEVGASQPALAA